MSQRDPKPSDLKQVIRAKVRSDLKTQMQGLEQNPPHRRNWSIGIVILILLALGIFMMTKFLKTEPKPDNLYQAYFQPAPNFYSPSERSQNFKSPLEQAFVFYDQQEFGKAVTQFEEIKNTEVYLPEVQFYHANALMASGQIEKARPLLEELTNLKSRYHQETEWLLALNYLKSEHLDALEEVLSRILSNPNHPYLREAKRLQKQL